MRPLISWSQLRGARAGVWGLGVEGEANLRKLTELGVDPVLVDDRPAGPGRTAVRCSLPSRAAVTHWRGARW